MPLMIETKFDLKPMIYNTWTGRLLQLVRPDRRSSVIVPLHG